MAACLRRGLWLSLTPLVLATLLGAPAGAASGGTDIGAGLSITGASVTCPGAALRTMDSPSAAAFIQSWLPYSIFGKPPNEAPPAGVPVCRVEVSARYQGRDTPMLVTYASDGHAAWVGMPPQNLGWAFVSVQKWIRAPAGTAAGFAGTATPTPVAASTGPRANTTAGGHHASRVWLVATIAGVVVVLLSLAVLARTRARRRVTRWSPSR